MSGCSTDVVWSRSSIAAWRAVRASMRPGRWQPAELHGEDVLRLSVRARRPGCVMPTSEMTRSIEPSCQRLRSRGGEAAERDAHTGGEEHGAQRSARWSPASGVRNSSRIGWLLIEAVARSRPRAPSDVDRGTAPRAACRGPELAQVGGDLPGPSRCWPRIAVGRVTGQQTDEDEDDDRRDADQDRDGAQQPADDVLRSRPVLVERCRDVIPRDHRGPGIRTREGCPAGRCPVTSAGRGHYLSSQTELKSSVGLPPARNP